MKRPPGKDMLGRARRLRRERTPAEALLWSRLRARQLDGFKFRQQMWLCGFIADFACVEAKLVIEADGGQHGSNEAYDRQRSAAFAKQGFRTLRFWNNEVLENIEGVLLTIRDALVPHPPTASRRGPPSPQMGEGNLAPSLSNPAAPHPPTASRRGPPSPLKGEGKGIGDAPTSLPLGEREESARRRRVGG